MKLKIKDLDILTGNTLVAIIHKDDARELDIHHMDRIKIKKKDNTEETAVIDIAGTEKVVKKGYIGVCDEIMDNLKLKNNQLVDIIPAKRPISIDFIRNKLDKKRLTKKEIDQIIWDIVHNKLSSIEMTYFVSACATNNMTMKEIKWLTRAIAEQGEIFRIKRYPIIDKHCIGGIPGNRTTPIVVAIIAAAGYTIPKTSSRSITSPAGTADTFEVMADVSFSLSKMKNIVEKTNGCIVWGGALNLAPADDKIIQVEKPISVDSRPQLLSSVMAKKASVSATHLLIDIPFGPGAKIHSYKKAKRLKNQFEKIGKMLRIKTKAILTNGREPIGNGIGPSLEAKDVLKVLMQKHDRPIDLEKKSIMLSAEILRLVGERNSTKKAEELLMSGKAYKKLVEIIKAQKKKVITPEEIPKARLKKQIKATKNGKIIHISNEAISKIARRAGAPLENCAGLFLHKHIGERVKKGDLLLTIYSESDFKMNYAYDTYKKTKPITIS